jgi:RNA polymerase sigma-70 factor, ECF subfamily
LNAAEARLKALMLAALKGDGEAYRMLLQTLTPHLRAYYVRRLRRAADAEDLVQETLIAIHTRRSSYDPEQAFTPWLHAVARYKLIDHLRRAKMRHTLPLEDADSVLTEEQGEAVEAALDVARLLDALPESRRALVRAVKIEGLSTAEAAARLGMSESAVKVGVHRALKSLARMIGLGSGGERDP